MFGLTYCIIFQKSILLLLYYLFLRYYINKLQNIRVFMENVVEQYLRNIEQFIKSNADSKKIDNIKVYLKNQAEIIYGIPMKKLK